MSNQDVLTRFAAKELRDLDLSQYGSKYQGQVLKIWVNCPAIIQAQLGGRAYSVTEGTDAQGQVQREIQYAEEPPDREFARKRKTAGLLYEMAPDFVDKLDDNLVEFLWTEGVRMYREYHEELRKN